MRIVELKAYPVSAPVPPEHQVTLGIGRMVKRDAVVIKVVTEDGIVGYGESHHGRCPGACGPWMSRASAWRSMRISWQNTRSSTGQGTSKLQKAGKRLR